VTEPVVRLEGISRRFGAVTALDGAELVLRGGEVHGVLGANGAGKTTLLSVLGGVLRPDAGTVAVEGRPLVLSSPRDAWAAGIALVHQHFTLVPALTVVENLALGLRRGRGIGLDLDRVASDAAALMKRTGLSVPLDAPVERLGVGDRQRTEILKAMLRDPRVLVLDEPTAVLAPSEIEGLFGLLRELAAEERAVVLVAHKLDEVLDVADRLTVLRDGRSVHTALRSETSSEALVRAMIGSRQRPPDRSARPGGGEADSGPPRRARSVARLRRVTLRGAQGEVAVDDVSLLVRAGEIVGIAGVEGNGQHQLALVLAGRVEPQVGEVELESGIGFIPQDRTTEGMIPDFDLVENAALAFRNMSRFRRGALLRWGSLARAAIELRERYRVAAPSVRTPVGELSGGNQQRVVVGRELAMASDLLVAENPTRGLDVSAAAFVHRQLRALAGRGRSAPGVVLISTDLDEVLDLSDRVFAMSRGRLLAVPDGLRTREGVGALMLHGEGEPDA
jgi:ABC-type uncharacterized transport system ATPase subunit